MKLTTEKAFARLEDAAYKSLQLYRDETGSRMRRLDWHKKTYEHLEKALEQYSLYELIMSVKGMFFDPFNADIKQRGKPYFSIDIALRPNNIDRFINRWEAVNFPPKLRKKIDEYVLLPHAKWFLKSNITDARKLDYSDRLAFRFWWATNLRPKLARIRTVMYWRKTAHLYGWQAKYLPKISTLGKLQENYVKLDQLLDEQEVSEHPTGDFEPLLEFFNRGVLPNFKKSIGVEISDAEALDKLFIDIRQKENYLQRIGYEGQGCGRS